MIALALALAAISVIGMAIPVLAYWAHKRFP